MVVKGRIKIICQVCLNKAGVCGRKGKVEQKRPAGAEGSSYMAGLLSPFLWCMNVALIQ